jgi:hypothetical protein
MTVNPSTAVRLPLPLSSVALLTLSQYLSCSQGVASGGASTTGTLASAPENFFESTPPRTSDSASRLPSKVTPNALDSMSPCEAKPSRMPVA